MKKIILFLVFSFLLIDVYASTPTKESRLFVHPFREVFVNLPSETLGLGVRLTIFLPEEKIPLMKQYPLAIWVGLPQDRLAAGEQIAQKYQLVLAVVSWETWAGNQVQDPHAVETFLHRELMPYLETNYSVLPGGENRILIGQGEKGAQAVLPLLKHPDWLGKIALVSPGTFDLLPTVSVKNIRFFIRGNQQELAHAQRILESAGISYGIGFAMRYDKAEVSALEAVDWTYLTAATSQLQLKRLEAAVQKSFLAVHQQDESGLRVWAKLHNGEWFDVVPTALRFSPPYLNWDPVSGLIKVVPGAAPGAVKVNGVVDNKRFSLKMKLKSY